MVDLGVGDDVFAFLVVVPLGVSGLPGPLALLAVTVDGAVLVLEVSQGAAAAGVAARAASCATATGDVRCFSLRVKEIIGLAFKL